MTGAVTLRDVALAAGVSTTTVSRVLNGVVSGVPIGDATRQRVRTTATQLGYRPNLLARGLRGSASSLLGVIARDIRDPFHVQVLRGINEVVSARDYRLFLGHVDHRADVAIAYGSMFERSHADGIIVIGDLDAGDRTLEALAERHRNVVGITDRSERRPFPGVYSDNVAGTRLAMEHLWSLGHRSIVCVADTRTCDGRLRVSAYERFMREHGVGDSTRVFVVDEESAPSCELGLRILALFARGEPATAIFATSDTGAIGIIQAAFQVGVSVPAQLSVVGYDDIDLASFAVPPLTTVNQSGPELGRLAAQVLLDMVAGDVSAADADDVVLVPRLVVRRSTAALNDQRQTG